MRREYETLFETDDHEVELRRDKDGDLAIVRDDRDCFAHVSIASASEATRLAIALIQATPETSVSAVRGEALWRDGRAADFIDEEDSPEDLIAIGLSLVRKGALIRAAGKR